MIVVRGGVSSCIKTIWKGVTPGLSFPIEGHSKRRFLETVYGTNIIKRYYHLYLEKQGWTNNLKKSLNGINQQF
jgi:hypothetical protein